MDATAQTAAAAPHGYKSRPGALIWSFRKSRDNWKRKYADLKASARALKGQLAAVTKSRDTWRAKAEDAGRRLAATRAERAAAAVEPHGEKKRDRPATR